MNWERVSNLIGVALVAVCFVFSLGRIFVLKFRERPQNPDSQITLRIAHFQLEGGVREAVDAIAKRYTELHPNVRVVQIPIPELIFKNWRITRLVGETPPDLIQMGLVETEAQLARYFTPLSDMAKSPNPYNKGTALEGLPLRETFFDGMESGFNAVLLEYYGVPATVGTIRMFYNQDLLREITGSVEMPKTYDDFLDLCKKTRAFAKRTGRIVFPLGGSNYNAIILEDYLFTGQTQRLLQEKIYKPGLLASNAAPAVVAKSFWQGGWSLQSPEIRSGLDLIRNVVEEMQPGSSQWGRDDAMFYFAQGGAVMIPSGTWDAPSLRALSSFPVGVGMLPLPDRSHPKYGKFAYGLVSEANKNTAFALAIPRGSDHPEIAADFLLFMSSMAMNKVWTSVSKWPPAVVGVEPSTEARAFTPREGGYPGGFSLNNLGADSLHLYTHNMFLLTGPQGSVDQFLNALQPEFSDALEKDMKRLLNNKKESLRRADAILASSAIKAGSNKDSLNKFDLLLQATVSTEKTTYQAQDALLSKP